MFLVAVDAHSKWPEVHTMGSTTAVKTLEVLRRMFASYGLPDQLVTDNGPQFLSEEFAAFVKNNGIKHIRTAPYHPASNGLAERFVQSLKQSLKTARTSGRTLQHRLSNFLLTYRSSPHATTGVTPSALFLNRPIRTRLDPLCPDRERTVVKQQASQKDCPRRQGKDRVWVVGDRVMARNLRPGPDWIPAAIVKVLGPVTYLVEVGLDRPWKRHADQLKPWSDTLPTLPDTESDSSLEATSRPHMSSRPPSPSPEPEEDLLPGATAVAAEQVNPTTEGSEVTPDRQASDDSSRPLASSAP